MNVSLVRKETGETVLTMEVPAHVERLLSVMTVFPILYGRTLDLDTIRFGLP